MRGLGLLVRLLLGVSVRRLLGLLGLVMRGLLGHEDRSLATAARVGGLYQDFY